MNIGAISQSILEAGGAITLPAGSPSAGGSFSQNVEKALSSMNKVSLKDEQDALDLSGIQGSVASLIMTFFASGGTKIELQDAQAMADKILGSDAMLDLLSYNEVSLNDIFLSNLNGGVLNGKETLADKIQNMDFTQLINAIKEDVSSDIDLDSNMTQLISQVMDEVAAHVNESHGKEQTTQSSAIFALAGQMKSESAQKNDSTSAGSLGMEAINEIPEEGINANNQAENGQDANLSSNEQEVKNPFGQEVNGEQDVNIEDSLNSKNQVETKHEVKVETNMHFGNAATSKLELAQVSVERPIEAANFTARVLEAIETSMAKGNDSLMIKLKPDFLGGIAIKLSMSEGGVIARIVTNNERTQNMLASQLTNLEATLKDKGIQVARMEVLYNPMNGGGTPEDKSHNHGQSKNNAPSRYVVEGADEVDSLEYLQLLGEDEDLASDGFRA